MSEPTSHARMLLPPAAGAMAALGLSLVVHLQAYVGLGWIDPPDARRGGSTAPMEVEILGEEPTAPVPSDESEAVQVPELDDPPERARAEREEAEREAAASREPVERPPQLPAVAPPAPPPPPQQSREQLTSVEHRSRDPNVEPPPDAQHLAEENSRVEQETMARVRNPNLADPEPEAARAPSEESEENLGDSAEEEVAELHDQEGSDARDPTPEETRLPPRPPRPSSTSRHPSVAEAARGGARNGASQDPGAPRTANGGGRRAHGGGAIPTREVIVSDGSGSFTVRVPVERPEGEGAGEGGGPLVAGLGRGRQGEGRASGRAGRGARRGRGGGARGRGAPNLRLSWSQFSSVYGEEELRLQREAYLEQRRSRQRGASRAERWRRFRAAIENYDVRVRPGNQTALNTRADPFAAFIAAMHRRIHPRFAEGYLRRLPPTVAETYRANPNMATMLEIGVDAQGRVDHVSVVRTSGDLMFDLGAYESVMGAQPFPRPPEAIHSPDGLTYMHWGFYRNQRQCGTFNARAYILADAPSRPAGTGDALLDRGTVFSERDEE